MSIFGKIMGAIFGNATAAPGQATGPGNGLGSTTGNAAPVIPSSGPGGQAGSPPPSGSSSAPSGQAAAPGSAGAASVDVAAIVEKAAASKGEKLNWKTSIVDLMKALDIDSSLTARKDLAKELGYTGDTSDSAAMNIWLHKQVMAKLAANGGKLPPEIKHS
jgi:hypothetical protein